MHNSIKIIRSNNQIVFMVRRRVKITFKTRQATTCKAIPSRIRRPWRSKTRIILADMVATNRLWSQIQIRNSRIPPWIWARIALVKKLWAIAIRSKCTSCFRRSRISSLRAGMIFRLSMKTSFRWRGALLEPRARTWRGLLRNATIISGSTPTRMPYRTKVSSSGCAARAQASSKGPSKRKAPTR